MITLMCTMLMGSATMDEVAVGALKGARRDVEYAGAIIKEDNGELCVTGMAEGNDDHFEFKLGLRGEEKIVAIFHTHIGGGPNESGWFSQDDVKEARKLGVISYIRDNVSKKIKKLGDSAKGEVVG